MQMRRPLAGLVLLAALWVGAVASAPPADPPPAQDGEIDWEYARALREKQRRGETLTPDEQAYLRRAQAARRGQGAPQPRERTGLVPLDAMTADDRYKEQDGGLYGGGLNTAPAEHLANALAAAERIVPRDAAGEPADDGRIGFISVGMSNTTQEFSRFVQVANQNERKRPALVLVDGAQGGQDSAAWVRPEERRNPDAPTPWEVLDRRLQQAGVSPAQVQIAWIKQARIQPGGIGEFPAHTDALKADLVVILNTLHEKYANLEIAYLSSRIYAGYAGTALNPEPYAYESAFAVRGLIRDQIAGEPALERPILLWGPYLWADGVEPRADGLTWLREDLAQDGTHPSDLGRTKVARLLLEFFTADTIVGPKLFAPADDA